MSLRIEITQSQATLILEKVFDYTVVNAFFTFVRELPETVEHIYINCEHVVHHDSAALGMLLFMQSELSHCQFAIQNCNERLTRMLYLSRLDRRFPITKTVPAARQAEQHQIEHDELALA
jgi:anti-anti-sigma factor